MVKIFLILLFIVLIFKFKQLKIHIDFKSLFKYGFKKTDNKFGLFCYVGKQGKGKTYSAVKFVTEQEQKYGYKCITNIKSFANTNNCIYISNIHNLIKLVNSTYKDTKYIILFDEIFTILEKNTPLNKEILSFLSQLRKKKIIFVTTAQEWFEINKTFRRYVRYEIECNMFGLPFSKYAFIYNIINDGENLKWSNDMQDMVAKRVASNFAKCERRVITLYDTFEVINT